MEAATIVGIYFMVFVFFGFNFYYILSSDKMNDESRKRLEERLEYQIQYVKDGDIKYLKEETKRDAKYLEERLERQIEYSEGRMKQRTGYLENRVERIEQRS